MRSSVSVQFIHFYRIIHAIHCNIEASHRFHPPHLLLLCISFCLPTAHQMGVASSVLVIFLTTKREEYCLDSMATAAAITDTNSLSGICSCMDSGLNTIPPLMIVFQDFHDSLDLFAFRNIPMSPARWVQCRDLYFGMHDYPIFT